MTFNLLTPEPLTPDRVTLALSQCLHVRLRDVDVADEATDQDLRNWDALVLCETATVLGDVSTSLDIYVQKSVRSQPNERGLAAALARCFTRPFSSLPRKPCRAPTGWRRRTG